MITPTPLEALTARVFTLEQDFERFKALAIAYITAHDKIDPAVPDPPPEENV